MADLRAREGRVDATARRSFPSFAAARARRKSERKKLTAAQSFDPVDLDYVQLRRFYVVKMDQ